MEEKPITEQPAKQAPVHETFEESLKSIMQNNSVHELVPGFEILSKLLNSLLTIENRANVHGIERSQQRKFRTIFS